MQTFKGIVKVSNSKKNLQNTDFFSHKNNIYNHSILLQKKKRKKKDYFQANYAHFCAAARNSCFSHTHLKHALHRCQL